MTQVLRCEVGFRSTGQATTFRQGELRSVPKEASMLTGDENIVNVQFSVQYKISDAVKYLFNISDPTNLVRNAAEAAMREVIGNSLIDSAITDGKLKIQSDATVLLQQVLDRYEAGIQVLAVQMQDVHPPQEVSDAFKDVASAREDKSRIINEAEAYRNALLPQARGEAAAILNRAEAYRVARLQQAEGDSRRDPPAPVLRNHGRDPGRLQGQDPAGQRCLRQGAAAYASSGYARPRRPALGEEIMTKNPLFYGVLLLVLAVFVTQCCFTVHQTQQALVLQLGDPLPEIYRPGLHFKLPFIQKVVYFDARVLDYAASSREAFTVDKKTIVLDNYARWRISDPLQFYRTMRTIPGAQARLDDVVYSQLRALVGAYTLTEVVSKERATIMARVTEKVSDLMKPYGVEVLDVRIKRTDLPTENQRSIFDRMRAERERQAKQYRSEGQEQATRIRSDADRQKALILAEANREAQVLYGQGDAQAAAVYAAAYGKAPEFYSYQRWLEALRKSFKENSKLVLDSQRPLLDLQK